MKIASVLDLLSRKRSPLFPVWHSFIQTVRLAETVNTVLLLQWKH